MCKLRVRHYNTEVAIVGRRPSQIGPRSERVHQKGTCRAVRRQCRHMLGRWSEAGNIGKHDRNHCPCQHWQSPDSPTFLGPGANFRWYTAGAWNLGFVLVASKNTICRVGNSKCNTFFKAAIDIFIQYSSGAFQI